MNKILIGLIILPLVFFVAFGVFADGKDDYWTPFKLSLLPPNIAFPLETDIYGLNLGLSTFNSPHKKLYGLDVSLIGTVTDNVTGVIIGIGGANKNLSGLQVALGGDVQNSTGTQICPLVAYAADSETIVQLCGILQESHNSDSSLQIGIYNRSINSKGIQIGLINYMDDGFLPFFPFINFSFNESYDDQKTASSIK